MNDYWVRKMNKFRPLILLLLLLSGVAHAQSLDWWVIGSTVKVTSDVAAPDDVSQTLQLHAAQQEYAPFQIVINGLGADESVPAPTVDYPAEFFTLQLYEEYFINIDYLPDTPEIFSLARLTEATSIADGLRPLGESLTAQGENGVAVVWADLYVNADTPAGDYTLIVTLNGDPRTVNVTVYPVDLAPSAAMSVIVPVDYDWTTEFYAPDDDDEAFHRAVNQLLLDNELTLGILTGFPELTDSGWDFTMFDAQIDAMPAGSSFYLPSPYRVDWGEYLFNDQSGNPYTVTDFSDAYFVEQLTRYYVELAAYLRAHNRLEGALAYPYDETRWVADEPDHNGAEGYVHLSQWTAIIRQAGLRVSSSRVAPLPVYSADWLPTEQIADDTHVHVDLLDAAPELFQRWATTPGRTASVYLNEYGDLIDMPSSIHRGMIWHAYARSIRMISGYNAMEWVTEDYDLVDPWTNQEDLYPVSGYGGGALVYPGALPSIRIKMLREGVEDARLLDVYAATAGVDAAHEFAACLTPGALADQNPAPDLWDRAHESLLVALRDGAAVDTSVCVPPITFEEEQQVIVDVDGRSTRGDWSFDLVDGEVVSSPFGDSGEALQLLFGRGGGVAEAWLSGQDWSDWDVLLIDVRNDSPTFAELDVAVGDDPGNYLLLRNGAMILGPQRQTTLILPLVIPYASGDEEFDWSAVDYIDLAMNTSIERTDGFDEDHIYQLTPRTIIVDNIRLARIER
jgi:hypothetical protein